MLLRGRAFGRSKQADVNEGSINTKAAEVDLNGFQKLLVGDQSRGLTLKEDSSVESGTSQEGAEVDAPFTVRSLRRAARAGYGDLIESYCDGLDALFITITHANQNTHPEFSVKQRNRWLNEVNQQLYGRRYLRRGDGLRSFFGMEYQEKRAATYGGRATVHQHGVIAGHGLGSLRRVELKARLDHLCMGFCKVELPKNRMRAINYCAKYAAKEGELDIWLPNSVTVSDFRAAAL